MRRVCEFVLTLPYFQLTLIGALAVLELACYLRYQGILPSGRLSVSTTGRQSTRCVCCTSSRDDHAMVTPILITPLDSCCLILLPLEIGVPSFFLQGHNEHIHSFLPLITLQQTQVLFTNTLCYLYTHVHRARVSRRTIALYICFVVLPSTLFSPLTGLTERRTSTRTRTTTTVAACRPGAG